MRGLLVLMWLAGCPGPDTDSDPDPLPETGDTDTGEPPETGVQVYARRCSACHGASAEGTAAGYELRHPPAEFATWVIRTGRSGAEFPRSNMPAWGERQLDDDQLAELLAWLDDFERPTTGAALFADLCGTCHGVDATGGVVRHDVRGVRPEDVATAVREGNGGTDYGVRREYMPAWTVDQLSDAELIAIQEWLTSLGE